MSEVDLGEFCRCSCHISPLLAMHLVPCCEPCPWCGANINFCFMDVHLRHCHAAALAAERPQPPPR